MPKKLKKYMIILLVLVVGTGCSRGNKKGIFERGNFNYNYITCDPSYAPFINEPVKSWRDYDGEQFEVVLKDGNHLVSSIACRLSQNNDFDGKGN